MILDSGAAVSVAPKSYFNRIPLEDNCNPEYRLQNASGDQLKIYGTRKVPFKLGRATIKIRTVICDVVQPLIATNDLLTKGVSVTLGTNGSYLTHLNKKYPLDKAGKHYRIRTRYPVSSVMPVLECGIQKFEDVSILQKDFPKSPLDNNSEDNALGTNVVTVSKTLDSSVKFKTAPPDQMCVSSSVYSPSCYEKSHTKRHETNIVPSTIFEVADSGEAPDQAQSTPLGDFENRVPMEADEPDIPLETLAGTRAPKDLVYLRPAIRLPTKEKQDKHNITHLPHEPWCVHCIEGRMIKDRSLTVSKEERSKRTGVLVQVDFFEYHGLRILAAVETTSSYLFARIVDSKEVTGTLDPKVQILINFLDELGKKDITLQSDQESTVQKICTLAAERFYFKDGAKAMSIRTRTTAPHSSNSNGSVERAIRSIRDQARVMFGYLTHKYGMIFHHDSKWLGWLIRHACWLINRLVFKKNKKTRYEDLYGRTFNKEGLHEFLSPVVCVPADRGEESYNMEIKTQQPVGLYLGKHEKTDQEIVLLVNGHLLLTHSIRNASMDIPMRKMVLSNYQSIKQEDHNDIEAYKHTSVLQPRMTMDKLIKDRAIGGTTKKWNKAAKRMYERDYGPNTYRPHDIVPVPVPPSPPAAPTIIIHNQLPTANNGPGRAQDQKNQGPTNQGPKNPDQVEQGLPKQGPEAQGTASQGPDLNVQTPVPMTDEPDHTQKTTTTFDTQKAEQYLSTETAQLENSHSQNEQLIQPDSANPLAQAEELQSSPADPPDYRLDQFNNLVNRHGEIIYGGYNFSLDIPESEARAREQLPYLGDHEFFEKVREKKLEQKLKAIPPAPVSLRKVKATKSKNKRPPADLHDEQRKPVPEKVVETIRHDKSKRNAKPLDREQNKFGKIEENDEINNVNTSVNKPTLVNPNFLFFSYKGNHTGLNHLVNSISPVGNEIYEVIESGVDNPYDIKWFENRNDTHILAVTVPPRFVAASPNPDKWAAARKNEMDSLHKFKVFDVIDRQEIPKGHPDPIGCRWLYTLKDYPHDTYLSDDIEAEAMSRYKARLIVQGMHEEVDDTYSPTPTAESVRTCLTIAVKMGWDIKFTDVSTAFLHAPVEGNKYVHPPPTEGLDVTKVWRLNKALYGLKSAPKAWSNHLASVLDRLGWTRSHLDECVYFKTNANYDNECKNVTTTKTFPLSGVVVAYVDDLIVAGESAIVEQFYLEFAKSCTCSPPEPLVVGGPAVLFLGFNYTREHDRIIIDPSDYTQKILDAFSHSDSKIVSTPGVRGEYLTDPNNRDSPPLDKVKHRLYRRLVGQCLWLSSVRRDISFATKELSKFVHAPTEEEVKRGAHLLKYLAGTKHETVHLCPDKEDEFSMVCYTDADLAGCTISRKSTSGGTLSINHSIVHSWAKQQDTVADSSGESEFIGLVFASKEVMYLRQFLLELGIVLKSPPLILVDSTVALAMLKTNTKGRVKHLDRKDHMIKDYLKKEVFTVEKVLGRVNLADLFTKYVDVSTLSNLRPAVMGRVPPPPNPPGGIEPKPDDDTQ